MEFNGILMNLRIKNKQTFEDIAKLLEIDVENLRAWESGDKKPTEKEIKKLSIFFDVDILSIAKEVEENTIRVKNLTLNRLLNNQEAITEIETTEISSVPQLVKTVSANNAISFSTLRLVSNIGIAATSLILFINLFIPMLYIFSCADFILMVTGAQVMYF